MNKHLHFDYYKNGNYEQAWSQLLSKSAFIRDEPLNSDAKAVARETMIRAKYNIGLLIQKLHHIGYRFQYPDEVYVPPKPDVSDKLDELEGITGSLPFSVRFWYEIVGSVNFIGTHPNFDNWDGEEYLPFDPLVVIPLEQAFVGYEQWQESIKDDGLEKVGPFLMPIAPDDYHKDDTSGGPPYEIKLPDPNADAILLNEWHNTTFVNYLRICFKWGGFPGFARHKSQPKELSYLISGLNPL